MEQIYLSFFLVLCFTLSFVICNPTDAPEADEDLCGQDVCEDGEECIDDTCRAAVATPVLCGKHVCQDGQECIDETCMAAVVPQCSPYSCKNEGELCEIKDSSPKCQCPTGLEVINGKCIDKKCVNVTCDWSDTIACFRGKCYDLCNQNPCNSTTICKADKKPSPKHICVPIDIPTQSTNKGLGSVIDINNDREAKNHRTEATLTTTIKSPLKSQENKITTKAPVLDTEENETTTKAPVLDTEENETTTKAPVLDTEKNETTTKAPVLDTGENETTTKAPVLDTEENETTTKAPVLDTQENETTTKAPVLDTQENETTTKAPVLDTEKNETTTKAPVLDTEKDETTTKAPVLDTQEGNGSGFGLDKGTATLEPQEDEGTILEPALNSHEDDVKQKNDESKLSSNLRPRQEETSSSGSFPVLFMATIALVIGAYFVYHNRAKVLGMVVEGRNGKEGRGGTRTSYQKLKNVEEAMPGIRGNHAA